MKLQHNLLRQPWGGRRLRAFLCQPWRAGSWTALISLIILSGCKNDDTDFSDLINSGGDTPAEEVPEPEAIEWDFSELIEGEEIFSALDNDYVENSTFEKTVYITFDGSTATLSGDTGYVKKQISGAHVTLTPSSKLVHFIATGTTSDGSLKFYSEKKFALTLDGVNITNPTGAAINNQCGKSMYITLADGSVNTLTDGSTYTLTDGEDQKGALFSEGQIIFNGAGSLTVNGNYRHGIASDDYILFRPGSQITVTTTQGHAIKANDGVTVRGSVLNLLASGNAAKGINSEAYVDIEGGRTTVLATGSSVVELGDTTSCACVKADSTVTVAAGVLRLKATGEGGKGINAKQSILVSGGQINVVTLGTKGLGSPKGIKSDMDITFRGGATYAYSLYARPVDAAGTLTIAPAYTLLTDTSHIFQLTY